ncbi:MAG: 50S ribosomal protein L13 [Parcubacteria group bacterium GW2011_GWB1_44_7]|nr:MAG: 50S ribosomal protein L13 [Parcubacteria group bacterium GW2011_GWB1_44_7]
MANSMKNVTIDATGRTLGRIASEAAYILMGKNEPDYQPNIAGKTIVTITNASKIKVTEKKLTQKMYERYSGYPGGLKFLSLKEVVARKGFSEALRLAVYGMLPANKLRPLRMKRLKISE